MESTGILTTVLLGLFGLVTGLGIGAGVIWSRLRGELQIAAEQGRAEAQLKSAAALASMSERAQRVPVLEQEIERLRERLDQTQDERAQLAERIDAERASAQEKIALLLEARESLTSQFRQLAADILDEKSKRFTEQNQTSLGQLLDPLRTRIVEFQAKVEDVYVKETRDRGALAEQVRQLMDLNRSLSEEAQNLTRALKGDNKTQGNWGELILERVLESAGLQRGQGYVVQDSRVREDGTRAQPDVVIHLPGDRCLVVDAKVSLNAYDDLVAASDDETRTRHLKRHLDSMRTHLRGLSERDYPALYGLQSLDCVLMFVPIEPAFMTAITQDSDLFNEAWSRNVLLVSPSTLMFVVRTVAHLWRTEAQNRNAQEIARRGAELYDRLAAFVADLDRVGERLQQAQESWSTARGKLASNRGNVIRQAEMLRELGVKPTKQLPAALIERALEAGQDRPVPIIVPEPAISSDSGTKMPRQALSGTVGSA